MSLVAMKYPFGEIKYQKVMLDCYDFHSHDVLIISAIEEDGELAFEFADKSIDVKSDTIVCFPPRASHKAVVSSDISGYCILHLDLDWIFRVYGFDAMNISWKRDVRSVELHGKFVNIVKELSENKASIEPLEEWLWEYFDVSILDECNLEIPNRVLEDIREYIKREWESPMGIEELSSMFDLNLYTMIRQFREHFGTTPKKYQLDIRVHKAKDMIVAGMDITQAALNCGFYDQSHLYNYFKKIFGVSPKAYQEAFEK